MKRKKLPKKKHRGLYLYCNKCNKYFTYTSATITETSGKKTKKEPTCGTNKKKLSSCKFPEKHKYKSRIHYPGQNEKVTSRTLIADTYSEAVIQAILFEEEFAAQLSLSQNSNEETKRAYLFAAQIKYIDFLNDVGVI